ncbi:uncharacterized protein [Lolium perenne]|uniref:uncharacterized protein n=1 Tax=Lolium perenne TaxID=4522 RepID=UPI003A9A5576
MSDHCPLLLVQDLVTRSPPRFRFESFWPLLEGYSDVVRSSWNEQCSLTNGFAILDYKLKRVAKHLKSWAKNDVGDIRKQLLVGQEIILRFDSAQETRQLTVDERELRTTLKSRVVGLAVLNRIKARQRARIQWLRLGDANTKFFHMRAANRKVKNRIHALQSAEGIATSPAEIEEAIFIHMNNIIGTNVPCLGRFDWNKLNLPKPNLSDLDSPFSEEEVRKAIFDSATDKAPGPDGFSITFFRTAWGVIKQDMLTVVNKFFDLNDPSFHCLNTALFVLLPKNDQPTHATHYRPNQPDPFLCQVDVQDNGK